MLPHFGYKILVAIRGGVIAVVNLAVLVGQHRLEDVDLGFGLAGLALCRRALFVRCRAGRCGGNRNLDGVVRFAGQASDFVSNFFVRCVFDRN